MPGEHKIEGPDHVAVTDHESEENLWIVASFARRSVAQVAEAFRCELAGCGQPIPTVNHASSEPRIF